MLTIQSRKFFCMISFTPRSTRFHCLFQAFHSCIRGFEFCISIIHVNGMWLYDNCRGILLIAVAQYKNNRMIPITFALVKREMRRAEFFIMKNPRRHVTPRQDVCMISDIHESIKSAYNSSLNGCHGSGLTHVYCI